MSSAKITYVHIYGQTTYWVQKGFIFNCISKYLFNYFFMILFTDSPETAAREINFFFPEFNIPLWLEREEPLFRRGEFELCKDGGIHIPKPTFTQPERWHVPHCIDVNYSFEAVDRNNCKRNFIVFKDCANFARCRYLQKFYATKWIKPLGTWIFCS